MGNSDRETVKVKLIRETDQAWQVESAEGRRRTTREWVPKSQCDISPEDARPGQECWLMIPAWLLDKKEGLA